MRIMTRKIIAATLVVMLGISALVWLSPWTDDNTAHELRLYGNVDMREVRMGFRVPGRLSVAAVEEGDAVEPGAVLAILDDQPYQQSLAVAQASIAEAEANLKRLRTGSRPQEIAAARAAVREAEAAFTNAALEYKRQQELMGQEASSQQQLDAALAGRDQAAARLASVQQTLALVLEGPRAEDIAAAEANLAAALARRDQAQTQLADTILRSPAKATVSSRVREPGSMLNIGEPVYLLTLHENVYIRAYVAESDLGRVTPGSMVTITTDSRAEAYHGRIGFVSPRAEFTPKTVETPELRTDLVYRLRIVVTDPDAALRQGMPVTISLPVASS
jgi:HlyD family secretion protein